MNVKVARSRLEEFFSKGCPFIRGLFFLSHLWFFAAVMALLNTVACDNAARFDDDAAYYTVVFDVNGVDSIDSGEQSQQVEKNGFAQRPSRNPIRHGYIFTGWYTGSNSTAEGATKFKFNDDTEPTPVTQNIRLYAGWKQAPPAVFSVTLDANGGLFEGDKPVTPSVPSQLSVFGSQPTPERKGYAFEGWYTERAGGTMYTATTPITEELVLYAHWKVNTYNVTFDPNHGQPAEQLVQSVNYGDYAKKPTQKWTRDEFTFVGWYSSSTIPSDQTGLFKFEGETGAIPITSDITLYAGWVKNPATTFTVTLDANGGKFSDGRTTSSTTPIKIGVLGNQIEPTWEKHRFNGWYTEQTGGTRYRNDTVISHDLTLYARWIRLYTITFEPMGGRLTGPDKLVLEESEFVKKQTDPRRSGYFFSGWYTDASDQKENMRFKFDSETGAVPVAGDIVLYAGWFPSTLEGIVRSGKVPNDLTGYDELTRATLKFYNAGSTVRAVYVTQLGGASKDGTSWATAWSKDDLKVKLEEITDASENKVYLMLVAGGVYPTPQELHMKNDVAIVGGWAPSGSWARSPTDPSYKTTFSGEKKYRVFRNENIDQSAALVSAGISSGYVQFCDAGACGAGMLNISSSPTLSFVTFYDNFGARGNGGAVYNRTSSPLMMRVTFHQNGSLGFGGAIYNETSSPKIVGTTFVSNFSRSSGGAVFNKTSTPFFLSSTFLDNEADRSGSAMSNNDNNGDGPTIVNSIFWGKTDKAQIFLENVKGEGEEKMSIYYSVLKGGLPNVTKTVLTTTGGGIDSNANADPVSINYSSIYGEDPKLATLGNNGGLVDTVALQAGSAAMDEGLYVYVVRQANQESFYYSVDGSTYYDSPLLNQPVASLPANAIEITAKDTRGFARLGRPDVGAYEFGGIASPPN